MTDQTKNRSFLHQPNFWLRTTNGDTNWSFFQGNGNLKPQNEDFEKSIFPKSSLLGLKIFFLYENYQWEIRFVVLSQKLGLRIFDREKINFVLNLAVSYTGF